MGFMVPIHAQISVGPSHEPARCSARVWSAAASEPRRRFRMVDYCRATEKSAVDAAHCPAPYTDRLRPVSRSDWMTVAVGFSPRLPEARIRVAERRLSGRICQPFKRRSATPTYWVLCRGLKPTATLGRRSATKPNQLSTIHVRS